MTLLIDTNVILDILEQHNTSTDDITKARTYTMAYFEDAVLAAAAVRENADIIISRNIKDFANSPVKAITPADYISNTVNFN